MADNRVYVVGSSKCNLQTHLLLGLAVVWLHFQDPLETAAGGHGVSKQQVALALPQMALWASHSEVHRVTTAPHSYPSGNHGQDTMQRYICDKFVFHFGETSTFLRRNLPSGKSCRGARLADSPPALLCTDTASLTWRPGSHNNLDSLDTCLHLKRQGRVSFGSICNAPSATWTMSRVLAKLPMALV